MVKKVIGIIVIIAGIAALIFSSYIKKQVEEGKSQIGSAQKKVNQGNSLFSLNPVAKEVGQGITGSAQKKINAGTQEVAQYEEIAKWLQICGIIVIVLGAGVLFLKKKDKSAP